MKRILPFALACVLLCGCTNAATTDTTPSSDPSESTVSPASYPEVVSTASADIPFVSRFSSETKIVLSDDGITVDGGSETDTVFTSHDIVYYETKTEYESGYPYGAGSESDMHTEEEAAAHTVVNITAPGRYRISGTIGAGQIRIDLGEDAEEDPNAVVELILDNAQITCTVAPAILFRNVYECDGNWSTETASATVDTSEAGAVLALEGESTVSGSYVAKIYKDKEGEKKRCKQDGAVYSYMSMNIYGPGTLNVFAENEGIDTELHLTINGGSIRIHADNDGINTNEDGVSVTTVNGGKLHILAGVGAEGDGIDSNGFITVNGGIIVTSANPASDSGLDSDLGTYLNGGTVLALGSSMDGAEEASGQTSINLTFSESPTGAIVLTYPDGSVVFAYDPSQDALLADTSRRYTGAVLSSPNLHKGETYLLFCGGSVTGTNDDGIYDPTSVSAYDGGTQMSYSGNGGMGHPGGMGRPDAMQRPDQMNEPNGNAPAMPNGEMPSMPEGEAPSMPDGEAPSMPDGEVPSMPEGERPDGFGGNMQNPFQTDGEAKTDFTLTDIVTAFSGVRTA